MPLHDVHVGRVRALNRARPSAQQGSKYRNAFRTDETARTASIDLYGTIGGWFFGVNATSFVKELRDLDVDDITLHINSLGGDVFDGIAIMNALSQHPAKVTAIVDGIAASAASFIAVGGADEVVMGRNAELMIHDAWGFAFGNAGDMRQMADELDRVSNNISRIYADRTGGSREDWRALMVEETWYSDEEAVEAGLADRILTRGETDDSTDATTTDPDGDPFADEDFWDSLDLSVFAHAGRRNAPAPRIPSRNRAPRTPAASASGRKNTPTTEGGTAVAFSDEQLDNLRRLAGVANDADEGTILAALDEALTESDRRPTALPEGVVAVDQATIDRLQADAAAGREAHDRQIGDHRERFIADALANGQMEPARREFWLNQHTADPEGTEAHFAQVPKNSFPLQEVGYDGADIDDKDSGDGVSNVRESEAYKNWRF